jgi:AraC-like DNA-binding protein
MPRDGVGVPAQPLMTAALPAGIATYSLRHGFYRWKPGNKPVTQLYPDWDIFWVRSGEAQWEFSSGRRIVARKDQFVILPPSVAAVVSESRPPMAFWFCHFGFRPAPANLLNTWAGDFRGSVPPVHLPVVFSRSDAPAVHRAYSDLIALQPTGAEPWRLERALVDLVARLVAFAHGRGAIAAGTTELAARRDPRVEALCARIVALPEHAWRVAALAASVGLSPGRLNAVFREATGTSLKRFIVTARLRLSLRLLHEHEDGRPPSVKAVSEACGFSSQHFFSRQFRSYFGLGPLAYRNGGGFG